MGFTMARRRKISRSYFIYYLKLVVLTEIVGPTPSIPLPCEITKVVCFNPDLLWDTCGTSEDYEGKRYTTVMSICNINKLLSALGSKRRA